MKTKKRNRHVTFIGLFLCICAVGALTYGCAEKGADGSAAPGSGGAEAVGEMASTVGGDNGKKVTADDPGVSDDGVTEAAGELVFIDDSGKEIILEKPCERIICLYPPHAENLYFLGAWEQVAGVTDGTDFPPEAAELPQFDYKGDPETLIAADPDVVLIRPFIEKKAPEFVQALEQAGILVVSLYPEQSSDFDAYINRLGLLSGKGREAKAALADFHQELQAYEQKAQAADGKKKVFFEATENNLRTVTPDSMAAQAIALAGGVNLAADAKPASPGSSIASFGVEGVLEMADDIDVYIAQKGAMNAGVSVEQIAARPGFSSIKAIQDGKVFVVSEKLVSAPTFRYLDGVKELAEAIGVLD